MPTADVVYVQSREWPNSFMGDEVVRTDEKVSVIGCRYGKSRALGLAQRHRPRMPSYHLRVTRVGRFKWEVAAFQNIIRARRPHG